MDRDDPNCAFIIVNAGSCCEDFARYGVHYGFGGHRMKEWNLFLTELRVLQPNIVFLENVDSCPEELHRQAADDLNMSMISGIDYPHLKSLPNRRARRFSMLWDPNIFKFDGSFEDFEKITSRQRVLTGDVYLISTYEERQLYYRRIAERKRLHYASDKQLALGDIMTDEEMKKLKMHEDVMVRFQDPSHFTYIADINCSFHFFTGGPVVPTITKSTRLVSLRSEGHILWTPQEQLAAMGHCRVQAT